MLSTEDANRILFFGEVVHVTKGHATDDSPFEVCVIKHDDDWTAPEYHLAWYDMKPEVILEGDDPSPEPTSLVEDMEPFTNKNLAIRAAKKLADSDSSPDQTNQ